MAEMMGKAVKHRGEFELIPRKMAVEVTSTWGYGGAYDHNRAGGKVFVIGDARSGYSLSPLALPREVVAWLEASSTVTTCASR